MKKLIIFGSLSAFLTIICAGVLWNLFFQAEHGPEKSFVVNKGENYAHVAGRLESEHIIRSGRAFRWYVNLFGNGKGLKRGEYAVFEGMSPVEIYYKLSDGKFI